MHRSSTHWNRAGRDGGLCTLHGDDELIERIQLAIKLEPNIGFAHAVLAVTYDAKGTHEQAIDEYQKWISIEGETTSALCYLAHAVAMSGKTTEAAAILKKLKTTKEYVSPAELPFSTLDWETKRKR